MEDKKSEAMHALVDNLAGAQEEMLEAIKARYGDRGGDIAFLVGKLASVWAALSFVHEERIAAGKGDVHIAESIQFAGDMMLAHGVMEFFFILEIEDQGTDASRKMGDEFLNSISALSKKCLVYVPNDGSIGSM